MLSYAEARRVYDRVGARQNSQAFYEDPAIDRLLEAGDFGAARAVVEFGCGTGRLAERLLVESLQPDARYQGTDLSPTMAQLARSRLSRYAARAAVHLTDGRPFIDAPDAAFDRFLSTYVFDLLSEDDVRATLREARRILVPGGLLCIAGLSTGTGQLSRAVARIWTWIQARRPSVVGGCRPLALLPFVERPDWQVRTYDTVVAYGIPSDVLVAVRS